MATDSFLKISLCYDASLCVGHVDSDAVQVQLNQLMDDDHKEHQLHQIGKQAGHDHYGVHQCFKLNYLCLLLFEVAVEHHIGGVHRDHMLDDVPNSETE